MKLISVSGSLAESGGGQEISWTNIAEEPELEQTCSKCNYESIQHLSIIRRKMKGCPRSVKEHCYTTLVGPILEYVCIVGDSYTQTNIDKFKLVQRRAAKFLYQICRRNASPSTMLNKVHTFI